MAEDNKQISDLLTEMNSGLDKLGEQIKRLEKELLKIK
ncbi:hypothetical protein LCGC14_1212940 [marine sediment metagenome]|uniref:Uncharacterized protein n=1 Tax=marine sediment metagenome TaxID=412755 RepID=A0A0F9LDG6_9ZZZZ